MKVKLSAKERESTIPHDFAVSTAMETMCRTEGLPNPHKVLPDFRDWALGGRVRKVDWEATFRRWMRSDLTVGRYQAWADEPPVRVIPPRREIEVTPAQVERFSAPDFDPTSLFDGLGKLE